MPEVKNVRILVVDDDKEFLEEVKEMLALSGYDVRVVCDGDATLEEVLAFKPSIIFLDLKMSPKSGFQIADELINILQIKGLRIIAMTGFFTAKEHAVIMKMCGVKKCILKPINPLDLIANIEFGLEEKEQKAIEI